MKPMKLFTDDRAVSPVVGVALLIAITVILAAVIGGVVLGIGTGGVDTPTAQLNAELDPDNNETTIHHNGGEPLPEDQIIVRVGNTDYEMSEDLTAGNSITQAELEEPDGTAFGTFTEDDEIVVLWDDPNSDSTTVLERFTV